MAKDLLSAATCDPPAGDAPDAARAEAARRFPVRVTAAVRRTMGAGAAAAPHSALLSDPVARQYLADPRELVIAPGERADPIGDHAHSPVKGIVHRHPDRVLFKVASVCAVNCRFCFRKTMLGTPEETLNEAQRDAALSYIEQHPEIREVILTGGDPLVLSAAKLAGICARLDGIEHLQTLRIHSRVPIAAPDKVTPALCRALATDRPLYMVVHVNHVQEISADVAAALDALRRSGVTLLSQSVLLAGVNDDVEPLATLFLKLLSLRVKPYYLHHPDMVPGTGHFRVPLATGQAIVRALRARIGGLAMPSYVLDIPGGFGKIPLEDGYIEEIANGFMVTDPAGKRHFYA